MPGYDRSGPMGEVPLTGGRQGRCGQGNRRDFLGRYQNTGAGGRRIKGMGQGFSQSASASETSELEDLKAQISNLNDLISQLNQKIAELENKN